MSERRILVEVPGCRIWSDGTIEKVEAVKATEVKWKYQSNYNYENPEGTVKRESSLPRLQTHKEDFTYDHPVIETETFTVSLGEGKTETFTVEKAVTYRKVKTRLGAPSAPSGSCAANKPEGKESPMYWAERDAGMFTLSGKCSSTFVKFTTEK